MKNRPKARLPRIESMGNELVSLNIMAEEVGSEVRQLTGRWSSLEEKVSWPHLATHLFLVSSNQDNSATFFGRNYLTSSL